jgi:hypothetical protein
MHAGSARRRWLGPVCKRAADVVASHSIVVLPGAPLLRALEWPEDEPSLAMCQRGERTVAEGCGGLNCEAKAHDPQTVQAHRRDAVKAVPVFSGPPVKNTDVSDSADLAEGAASWGAI